MRRTKVNPDKNNFKIKVSLETILFKDDNEWIGFIPALDLYTYGTDQKDTENALKDLIPLFITDCIENGTLEKNLFKLGWKFFPSNKPKVEPPLIPLNLLSRFPHKKINKVPVSLSFS